MKRTFYIKTALTVLATTAIMACTESYPTMILEETKVSIDELNKDDLSKQTPVLMFINQQDLFTVTSTRGIGQFPPENVKDYATSTIYVYAFRDGKNSQGSELLDYADLTKTAHATGRPHDVDNESCLIDGTDYNHGLSTYIMPGSAGELVYLTEDLRQDTLYKKEHYTDEVCYYSNRYQETPYNFFAYYMDDFDKTATPHRTRDSIWYDFKIDGTQDLMCGMAPPIKDVIDTWYKTEVKALSEKERSVVLNGYSKYAADRDIHPYIMLKHKLTQLRFKIYPADSTASDIVVQKIELKFKKNGHMTVATLKPTESEPKVWFDNNLEWGAVRFPAEDLVYPADDEGTVIDEGGYVVTYDKSKGKSWSAQDGLEVGRGIIIPSDSVYDMLITYKQKVKLKDTDTKKVWTEDHQHASKAIVLSNPKSKATADKMFKPGMKYTVNIAVYGRKGIEVYTAFEEWQDGGSTDVEADGW